MKIKNFHNCDNFYRTIVQAYIIAFCIYYKDLTKINDLQIWLSKNKWPDLIVQIEGQYLDPKKIQNLYNRAEIDILIDIATKLNTWKQKFEVKPVTAIDNGIQFKKYTPR